MSVYSIYNTHGEFVSWVDSAGLFDGVPPENSVSGTFGGRWYFDFSANAPVQKPPCPSPAHTFNTTSKQWEFDGSVAWAHVRARRNDLLTASDWTQLPDVPLAAKEAWAAYRQALRDVTGQPDPFNISWPQAPQ